jgi:3-phosphoshikimate 1-carboxyvinyltransferase
MRKYISKSRAEGKITPPSSKSISHRMLISAAMCPGEVSVIHGITPGDDVMATIDCLRSLGVKIEYSDGAARVHGIDISKAKPTSALNCRESGSTLRFLIPIALLSGERIELRGSKRLFERPLDVYEQIGFHFEKTDNGLVAYGKIHAGEYDLPANVSSQFITGLIFALSNLKADSKINITTKIESRHYIDLTISTLEAFGIKVMWESEGCILIQGGQCAHGGEFTVEGDWSAAAFMLALNHLGGNVTPEGLAENSLQADKDCTKYFNMLDEGFCEINIENCPDLAPILFVVAAAKHGAKFIGTRRLKIKESDRAHAMQIELSKFGADIVVLENSVIINKSELHSPSETLFGHNDHRVVMSLAILSTVYGGEIDGCDAVTKSYPDFWEDLMSLGIKVS